MMCRLVIDDHRFNDICVYSDPTSQSTMHPPREQRSIECGVIMDQLNECHKSFLRKYLGGCNSLKDDLTLCLRRERKERQKANAQLARERRKRVEAGWKEVEW